MYLTKQDLLLLKTYQKHRSKIPTLPSLLLRRSLSFLLLLGACIGIWLLATAPGGSREWGWGAIGFLSAIMLKGLSGTVRFWQYWPVMREIINWQRVDELVQQSEFRLTDNPKQPRPQ